MDFNELNSARNLRQILRDRSPDEIRAVIALLQQILEETVARRDRSLREFRERQAAIRRIREEMDRLHLRPDDLNDIRSEAEFLGEHRKARIRMPVRFRYTDLEGEVREWSGQGKLPNPLRELLRVRGGTKEDYRIRPTDPLPDADPAADEDLRAAEAPLPNPEGSGKEP